MAAGGLAAGGTGGLAAGGAGGLAAGATGFGASFFFSSGGGGAGGAACAIRNDVAGAATTGTAKVATAVSAVQARRRDRADVIRVELLWGERR